MKTWIQSAAVIASGALSLCACGDSDDANNTADAGATADAAAQAPDAAATESDAAIALTGLDAICAPQGPFPAFFEKMLACNSSFLFFDILGTDLLSGIFLEDLCRSKLGASLEGGTVTIDESKIQACLEFVQQTSCELLDIDRLVGTPCNDIFVGSLATGGECDVSEQCVGDAFCDNSGDENCGQCAPRIADGELCFDEEECSSGVCTALGQCAAPAGIGDACLVDNDCASSLECDEQTPTCQDRFSKVGDECLDEKECGDLEQGLFCKPADLIINPSTCQPLPEAGEACVSIDNQLGCNFTKYVWCNDGTCQAPESSSAGQPCNVFPQEGKKGEDIQAARRCESGLRCTDPFGDTTQGICLAAGLVGDTCQDDEQVNPTAICHPLYECEQGICEADSDFTGQCPAP